MITSVFQNIKISGVAGAVPTKQINNSDYGALFGDDTVEKIIKTTGIKTTYQVNEKQTASDLAFVAAEHLLKEKDIDPASIGVLIFVVSYADYFAPASAAILQKRLGISMDCIVFDMNLGCSGFVYGLQTISSLLQSSSAQRALLLVGDTTSKIVSKQDKSRLLFGDAGTAILVEKDEKQTAKTCFGLKSDGNRFKSIIVPAGAFRNPNGDSEQTLWGDGNIRSDYNLFMDGTDVFSFTMTDVPALFKEFMEYYQVTADDFDSLVLHQPNLFILKHLAKKIKVPMDKVPLSLDRYGNTSGNAIPLTLCDAYGEMKTKKLRILMSGFGVGLSWGVASLQLDADVVLPIIHTDDYYKDGDVSHD